MEYMLKKIAQGCISYVNRDSGVQCNEAVDIWDKVAVIQDGSTYLSSKRCLNYLTCSFNYANTDNIVMANTNILNLFQDVWAVSYLYW